MNRLLCGALLLAFFDLCLMMDSGLAQVSKFDQARAYVEKWVQTKQLIAKRKADWRVGQENIKQSIGLLKKEIALLDKEIAQTNDIDTEADLEKKRVSLSLEDLKKSNKVVGDALWNMERKVLGIISRFPEPLKDRTTAVRTRIPLKIEDLRNNSAAERMQNIIAILNEADRFNSAITMAVELRKYADGNERQVQVIYLGLGQAYFVDQNNTIAGRGVPGSEGWIWSFNNGLAPKIRKIIGIYENGLPAEFVSIPVEIK